MGGRERGGGGQGLYGHFGKRLLDLLLGIPLFILALPVISFAALAVLVSSGRPIFYRAHRLGKGGRPFQMLKLRTMVKDADRILDELLTADRALAEEYVLDLKLQHDPRMTRFGGLLRKLSIDELPQLWHVIKGEMSLVGPRPYAAREREMLREHLEILNVTPGLTGPWQVGGRNDVPWRQRVALDAAYALRHTAGGDIGYLLATVRCLLRPNGI